MKQHICGRTLLIHIMYWQRKSPVQATAIYTIAWSLDFGKNGTKKNHGSGVVHGAGWRVAISNEPDLEKI